MNQQTTETTETTQTTESTGAIENTGTIENAGKIAKREYSTTIDILKGMAMIMVIMLHFDSQSYLGYGVVMTLFYSVPLYFLVSGYLLSHSANRSFGVYFEKRVLGLLVPYALLFAFNLLWTCTGAALLQGEPAFVYPINWFAVLNAFAFAGKFLFDIAVVPAPLWFLHALFLYSILFYFIAKIKSKVITAALAIAFVAAAMPLQNIMGDSPYWIITMLPVALFFMTAGHLIQLIREKVQQVADEVNEKTGSTEPVKVLNAFVGLGLIVTSILLMRFGRGDMWCITSDWYFPAALVFIAGCYLFARESKNSALLFTGRNSLYYLGLHPIVLQLPFMETLFQTFRNAALDDGAAYFCFLIVAYLMTTLLVFVAATVVRLIKSLFRPKRGR